MKKIFGKLIVWQKMHELVLKIYKYTKQFPREEKYGLVDDMRRAARSIANNFVEGFKRKGYKDAMNFFNRSDASLVEIEYQTLVSRDLNYLTLDQYDELEKLEDEIGKLLTGWQRSYKAKTNL